MNTDYVSLMARGLVEVEVEAGRLQAIALEDVGSQRPVGLIWRRNETLAPTAARLVEILRRVSKEEARPHAALLRRKGAKAARRR
jgi:DNA-binding transcriptional LysR family regulator